MFRRRPLSMKLGILAAALVLATGATASLAGRARAEAPALEGVLVLRNGNVLAGSVRRFGDDYRIDASGAVLQVPAGQVEMFAPTLEEAYEQRRRDRTGTSADSHLELARWCMQLNLLSEAARELLDARTLDPAHSGLATLETRLRLALELDAAGDAGDNGVVTADVVVAATDDADAAASPSVEISSETQIEFVRSIQPMLIRSCATGGCHQPGAAERLQLDRWALEGNGNAEMVRRNLTAVLRELDAADPPSSALMQWARLAHGRRRGAQSRPLAAHQAALLMEWLNDAAGIAPPDFALAEAPVEASEDGGQAMASMSGAPRSRKFTPRDEFDAEIFNRRTKAADKSDDGAADVGEADSDSDSDAATVDAELLPPPPTE